MRAMGCLRIAFADREITLDDFNRGVSLRALWSSGEHSWHPFCSTRLDSAIHAKAAAQQRAAPDSPRSSATRVSPRRGAGRG